MKIYAILKFSVGRIALGDVNEIKVDFAAGNYVKECKSYLISNTVAGTLKNSLRQAKDFKDEKPFQPKDSTGKDLTLKYDPTEKTMKDEVNIVYAKVFHIEENRFYHIKRLHGDRNFYVIVTDIENPNEEHNKQIFVDTIHKENLSSMKGASEKEKRSAIESSLNTYINQFNADAVKREKLEKKASKRTYTDNRFSFLCFCKSGDDSDDSDDDEHRETYNRNRYKRFGR